MNEQQEVVDTQDLHPTLGLPEGSIVKVLEDTETAFAGDVGFIVRQDLEESSPGENEWGFSSFNSPGGVCYEIPYENFCHLKYFDDRFYRVLQVQGEYIHDLEDKIMLLKWGSVSSQYWTEGQKDLFDLNQGWQQRQLDQELNYAQALYVAFQTDYLTAGPNWVNNTCGEYDVTIYIHEDCGYGDCQGVSFSHEGDPWQSNEDRIDLFVRCVAKATNSTPEYVLSALRENGFDFARDY